MSEENHFVIEHHQFVRRLIILSPTCLVLLVQFFRKSTIGTTMSLFDFIFLLLIPFVVALFSTFNIEHISPIDVIILFAQHIISASRFELSQAASQLFLKLEVLFSHVILEPTCLSGFTDKART